MTARADVRCPVTGKHRHATWQAADNTLRARHGGVGQVLTCADCGGWHVTSRPLRGFNRDIWRAANRRRRKRTG